MIYTLELTHQKIRGAVMSEPVNGTHGYAQAVIVPQTDDWTDCDLVLIAKNYSSGVSKMSAVVDGRAEIPWEVLEDPGVIGLAVHGTKSGGAYKITSAIFKVTHSQTLESASDSVPTPDIVGQYVAQVSGYVEEAEGILAEIQNTADSVQDSAREVQDMLAEATGTAEELLESIQSGIEAAGQIDEAVAEMTGLATRAETACTGAEGHAQTAGGYATTAGDAKDAAVQAKDAAIQAKTAAETARDAAQASASSFIVDPVPADTEHAIQSRAIASLRDYILTDKHLVYAGTYKTAQFNVNAAALSSQVRELTGLTHIDVTKYRGLTAQVTGLTVTPTVNTYPECWTLLGVRVYQHDSTGTKITDTTLSADGVFTIEETASYIRLAACISKTATDAVYAEIIEVHLEITAGESVLNPDITVQEAGTTKDLGRFIQYQDIANAEGTYAHNVNSSARTDYGLSNPYLITEQAVTGGSTITIQSHIAATAQPEAFTKLVIRLTEKQGSTVLNRVDLPEGVTTLTLDENTEKVNIFILYSKPATQAGWSESFTYSVYLYAGNVSLNQVIDIPAVDAVAPYGMKNPLLLPAKFRYILHRGASTEAPENTVPAFDLAGKKAECWAIETDIYESTDGGFYCFHDAEVDRMTDGTGSIASMTSSEIEALTIDAGANVADYPGLKIPTLEAYLLSCKASGKVPVIEIKTITHMDELVAIVRDFGMLDGAIFFTDSTTKLSQIRALTDAMLAMGSRSTSDITEQIDTAATYKNCMMIRTYTTENPVTQAAVQYAHRKGIALFASVINSAGLKDALLEMGADGILTDDQLPASAAESEIADIWQAIDDTLGGAS